MTRKVHDASSSLLLFLLLLLVPARARSAQGDCGQPVTNGSAPTASDCLYILRTAVGSEACTPECICDVNAAGGVTATDALTCLKKAVGQNVTLDCGAGCGTTTTTLPTMDTTEMIVATKRQVTYATANLAGTWDVSGLATGPDAPYWARGSLTIQSNGSFSGSITDIDGANDNVAGKLAVSSSGIVTCTSSQCPLQFQGALDAGKTFMAITYTGENGTTELLLGTKRGGSYAQADLAGAWEIGDMVSVQAFPWWIRGAVDVLANGATSGDVTASDGHVESVSLTLALSGKGSLTCTSGCEDTPKGALDSEKTLATATYTGDDGAAHLMVMCRKGASYTQADLTGTWQLNSVLSGQEAPRWLRGAIVVQSGGAFSGSLSQSSGGNENVTGTFTLSSDGIVTASDDDQFRCAMDAGKTVFVCTDSD